MAADPVAIRARRAGHGRSGSAAATELTLDIIRNAANKIAVAFDAEGHPQVETGVEYYDIDVSTGELRAYNVSPVTP